MTLALFSCNESNKTENNYSQDTSLLPTQTNNNEGIDEDSILLNNRIPFLTTIKRLTDNLGNPDSIIKKHYDCSGYFDKDTISLRYYNESVFETLGDTSVLQKIYFKHDNFKLKTPTILLDNRTTLKDIKRCFPKSLDDSNDIIDPTDKKTYRLVRISTKKNFDCKWVLKFADGRLIEIEYWIAC